MSHVSKTLFKFEKMLISEWSSRRPAIIGMLHALPLPGSPDYAGDMSAVRSRLLQDADALISGGVDALMLENFGDSPFYPDRVPAVTVAVLTSLAVEVRRQHAVPLGINVLRNDGRSALAIAVACGLSFIRVNVLCSTRVADQGLLHAIAHDLLRDRANLNSKTVQIWADVDVKHSSALAKRSLKDEVRDLIDRGKADAVIVTGTATGQPIDLETLRTVKDDSGPTPVILGSGASHKTIREFVTLADAIIVGSSLKANGRASNPVELDRVRQFVDSVRSFS